MRWEIYFVCFSSLIFNKKSQGKHHYSSCLLANSVNLASHLDSLPFSRSICQTSEHGGMWSQALLRGKDPHDRRRACESSDEALLLCREEVQIPELENDVLGVMSKAAARLGDEGQPGS